MNVLDNMPMPDVVVRQQPVQAPLAPANNVNNVNNAQVHHPVGLVRPLNSATSHHELK
mgnify:CR=1 FL=1